MRSRDERCIQRLEANDPAPCVHCYPLLGHVSIPPAGDTYKGTKSGRLLTITSTGTAAREPLVLRGPRHDPWARRIRARGSFRVIVIDSHASTTELGQELIASGVSRKAAERIAARSRVMRA